MKAILQSNKICVNNDDCNSVVVKYRNDTNAFDFDYDGAPEDFYQKTRLNAFIRDEEPEIKEKIYRRHDGTFKNTGVTIDEKSTLQTDQYDSHVRRALVVASRHSEFLINDIAYSAQGEPEIGHNDFNNLASVKIEIFEQGFNQSNISC